MSPREAVGRNDFTARREQASRSGELSVTIIHLRGKENKHRGRCPYKSAHGRGMKIAWRGWRYETDKTNVRDGRSR